MNRRNFLSLLGMTAGGLALEQAIPFNRVWSFPKNIVIPQLRFLTVDDSLQLNFDLARARMLAELEAVICTDAQFLSGYRWPDGVIGTCVGIEIDDERQVASHISIA